MERFIVLYIMTKNTKRLFYFILICGIIVGIMIPTWGSSPKAQDDPTTIDEAINAAIVAHEADPTAHLGDGESLQQHKNNEVIDHPAFSIVADKSQNKVMTFYENFSYIATAFPPTGVTQLPIGFRVSQSVASQSVNREIEYDQFVDFIDDTGDNILDVTFVFKYSYTTDRCTIHLGADPNVADSQISFGATITNGNITIISSLNGNNSSTTINSLSLYKLHTLRFSYDPTTRIMSVFLDGEYVHETIWPATTHGSVDVYSFIYGITRNSTLTGSDSCILYILSLVFSSGYIG